jgi:hypothetical protein
MGFRFRRSVKILPGVRLNFGKRGVSTSIGVRWAHVTFGKSGTRTTVGLPGSGLSYTHLENRHTVKRVESPLPHGPEMPEGDTRRGYLWIALILALIVWCVISNAVSAAPSVVGEWRGQTQYQGTQDGHDMPDAHTAAHWVLTLSADGKVSGTSSENACTVAGIWSSGANPRLFPLDITLSNCRDAKFNRRYSGSLLASAAKNSGQLTLQAFEMPVLGQPVRTYDIKATLRR